MESLPPQSSSRSDPLPGPAPARQPAALRVLVVGSTGYIGRFVVRALVERGHRVTAFARPSAGIGGRDDKAATRAALPGAEVRFGDVTRLEALLDLGERGQRFDAVVSCLASRSGGVADSWRIDYAATATALEAAKRLGATRFVLLSAICVQKPELAFQQAKLKFEHELMASGLTWSIVRPTAFFKSLAAQVASVQRGFPYVMFGDGELTACKPLSERDLAAYVADCLEQPELRNRVLPIGGPGAALTAREQGDLLFELLGRPPRRLRVPVAVLDLVILLLATLRRLIPALEDSLEAARIGRYYATESMLVWDAAAGCYDAAATPSTGSDTLRDFYQRVLAEGLAGQELGDQWPWKRQ